MSHEEFPGPNQNIPHQSSVEKFEDIPKKNGNTLQEALRYIDSVAGSWILEPSEITVEQPNNQTDLLNNLESMLLSQQDGEILQDGLIDNMSKIRRMQAQPEHSGFSNLDIRSGYVMNDLLDGAENLSRKEYETIRDNSWSDREIIDDPDQPNVMVSGLLLATGAVILRNEVDADGAIKKIYKGMLDDKPVYFEEIIMPRIREDWDNNTKTIYLERLFKTISENSAKLDLIELSAEDADVLRSIGVEFPDIYSPDYNPDVYPNRSRMIEIVNLYGSINTEPSVENGDSYLEDANIQTMEALPDPVENLKQAQLERDKQEKIVISNFRAHGATKEQIEAYKLEIERMKLAELQRGRLFPHQAGFLQFETLSNTDTPTLDMGIGSGFEQGDWVAIERSTGELEYQWTFMGINPKTGFAEVAKIEESTNQRLYKSIPLEELKRVNNRDL